jgi:hypothetical protein
MWYQKERALRYSCCAPAITCRVADFQRNLNLGVALPLWVLSLTSGA